MKKQKLFKSSLIYSKQWGEKTLFKVILGLLVIGIVLISGCGSDKVKVTGGAVVEGMEFQIQKAEYKAGKIIVTLKTNTSVENARIDIIDEADQLLCTRYKDLIAGLTQIEITDCKAKEEITVSVSPPGGGIITEDFTLAIPKPRVEVVKAEYKLGAKLVIKLKANMDIENTRMEISDEKGVVLCTEYVDLLEGLNEIKPKGCGSETTITISITPPEGVMRTAEFVLELPLLELKEGFKYIYKSAHCPGCSERDSFVYVTKKTSRYWEGITGIKIDENKKAYLMKWKIDKDELDLSITRPLSKDDLLNGVNNYIDVKKMQDLGEAGDSIMALWMVVIKEMLDFDLDELITKQKTTLTADNQQEVIISTAEPELYGNYLVYRLDVEVYQNNKQTDSGEIIISAAELYLMIETDIGGGPQTSFKRVEEKEFSLNDFSGKEVLFS